MKKNSLLLLAVFCASLNAFAQSGCDSYYEKATRLQQTLSIQSQNQAIKQFEKAMDCYDSESMKERCKNQIATCRNTIRILREDAPKHNEPVEGLPPSASQIITSSSAPDPVQLSADITNVKFHSKGGYIPVKVFCNYDWEVSEKPDWVNFYINKGNGELIIQTDTFRHFDKCQKGKVVVDCRGVELEIVVEQQSILWLF